MQVFYDMWEFIKTLSFVDVIFFFAVLALMLLIITLIYFIKENSDEESSDSSLDLPKKKQSIEEKNELDDLKKITEALENAEPSTVHLNQYEEEQEEKAIISYDELLKRKNDFAINYSEEENIDEDLTIKKVDLDHLLNTEVTVKPELKVSVISYEKEEAFLEALKTLQKTLN